MRRTISIFDVQIDNVLLSEALDLAKRWLDEDVFHQVVTPGPEFLLEATVDPKFKAILNRADLSLPDGMGLYLASKFIGQPLRGRVTGVDFILGLMSLAAVRNCRVFLYGGQPGVANQAAQVLIQRYPGLAVVGVESGWRGPWQKLHDRRVVEKIHLARPDILLVALGAPKQEIWVDHHRQALHHVKISIGVGRTFDYLAGRVKRAPAAMRRLGLEWLHTFFTAAKYYQPQHRRQRIVNATWHFSREFARRHLYARYYNFSNHSKNKGIHPKK